MQTLKEKIKSITRNGLKHTPTYITWVDMKRRCNNSSRENYKYYGKRGIKICERWLEKDKGFKNFLEDMGEKPEGLSLDRIDNNKDYCKENCKWSTKKEQRRNQRRNKYLTFNNRIQLLTDWAKEYNLSPDIIWQRIYRFGWSIEKALLTPVRKCKRK